MKTHFIKKKFIFLLFLFLSLILAFPISKPINKVPDLTVVGFINLADGIGKQSYDLIRVLKNEMHVNFTSTRKIKNALIPKNKKILQKKEKNWGKVVVFEDFLWVPYDENLAISKLDSCPANSIKIAYSMYEATSIPNEWAEILNKKFDAVAVPSEFLVKVYEKSGVNIPIFFIPLGIDLKKFLGEPLKIQRNDPMVFSNFSAVSDRKNHSTLILAFHKAFGDDPSVLLRINARFSEKKARNRITRELAHLNYPTNIYFTQFSLSNHEYFQEFKKTDCYVSPSKGEGFSIQPRQAMAMGIPVIATYNTGQQDICESGLVKTVKSELKEIATTPWGDCCGYHFNCEIDDLANALIDVRKNFDSYLAEAQKARLWAAKFQMTILKSQYKSMIQPKQIIFGDKNLVTDTYLMTNSKKLFKKYCELFANTTYINDNSKKQLMRDEKK